MQKKKTFIKTTHILIAAGLLAASSASAAITIDTVLVGDLGNADDSTGYGGVAYKFHIGTYEVTNSQYTAFLNATAATDTHGLYDTAMSSGQGGINRSGSSGSYSYSMRSGFENKPVNYVSFWDAARFANWLTNGSPSGPQDASTTETGVYSLNGTTNPGNSSITRNTTAFNAGGVAITTTDEWYKAAYYDPTLSGGTGGYYNYPTQSDSGPTANEPNSNNTNSANHENAGDGLTDVGSYSVAVSFYGTFDQGGNVWEWTEEVVSTDDRRRYGGSFANLATRLSVSNPASSKPDFEAEGTGFRVVSLQAIPEPSTFGLLLGSIVLLLAQRRRMKN